MSFLPENYKEPSAESNYLNLNEEGDYTIRILSEPIMGYEYWKTVDGKRVPIRKKLSEKIDTEDLEVNEKTGELDIPKFFWAMKVYNWDKDQVQIWEVKQSTIRKPLEAYARNKAWGDPMNYDLVITRTGKELKTEYQVVANPPIAPLEKEVQDKCDAVKVRLEALYKGDDPFKTENEVELDEIML